jgi:hypothetical protein
MLERYNPILRLVCLALAGLIVYQISRLAFQRDAVARGRIETPMIRLESTNKAKVETNSSTKGANSLASTNSSTSTNSAGKSTNAISSSTNSVAAKTNFPNAAMQMRMASGPRRGPSGGAPQMANLPPDVQATIDKIRQSQLLGPDIKPPPMALMGIAGPDVFLRGPNGQTGIIRVGEELGGVKLIRVGTNRVIVEENGQQKELTIFSGFGSETLMEKKDKP